METSLIGSWLDAALRAGLLLGVAGLTTLALPGRMAALRHVVWALALVGALVVPLAPLLMPALTVTVPSWSAPVTSDGTPRSDPAPVIPSLARPAPAMAAGAFPRATPRPEISSHGVGAADAGSAVVARPGPIGDRIAPYGLGAWLLGVLLLLARAGYGWQRAIRLVRRSEPCEEPAARAALAEARRRLGVSRPVDLRRTSELAVPMTLGWRRPVVLLPEAATAWSAERLEVVLRHEVAHIRRGDVAVDLLAQASRAVHWLNPLAWIAVSRLRLEREHACDDEVLALGTLPSTYAQHLVQIAGGGPAPAQPVHGVGMARPGQLESRIVAILDGRTRRGHRRAAALVAAGAVLTIVTVSAVTPAAPQDGRAPTSPSGDGPVQTPPTAPTPTPDGEADREQAERAGAERESVEEAVRQQEERVHEQRERLRARETEFQALAERAARQAEAVTARMQDEIQREARARARDAAAQARERVERMRRDLEQVEHDHRSIRLEVEQGAVLGALGPLVTPGVDETTLDDRVLDAFLVALDDPDPEVREEAARALRRIRGPRSTAALVDTLETADEDLRLQIIRSLATREGDQVLDALVGLTEAEETAVRLAAIRALSRASLHGHVMVPPVIPTPVAAPTEPAVVPPAPPLPPGL